ncbi:MAG: thiamine-phosphate kinase [Halobacteriaceae archaeon]
MDERAALALVTDAVGAAGDDAAVVDGRVVTTDMLHERADFPPGTTRYTAGWRAVGASLSDVAAMGAGDPVAVAVYAAPTFEESELRDFVAGANGVCAAADGAYVGGDLDTHDELTVATTALGDATLPGAPVGRDGTTPGEAVCVTGTLGRSAAALRYFEAGDPDRGNDLFQFTPRVAAGRALAPHATAMMDSSDGLARSLHQLAAASDCGFAVEGDALPVDPAVSEIAEDAADERAMATSVGEDFELVCTVPEDRLDDAIADCPVPLAPVGRVTAGDVTLDGDVLPDVGYTHGGDA